MSELGLRHELKLKIGFDGISSLAFSPAEQKLLLAVGTCGGRVRIYNHLESSKALLQRRWHKSIRCLSFFSTGNHIVSASNQSGLKIHDVARGDRIWRHMKAHENVPISSLIVLGPFRWATGDECGLIKLWDSRQPECVAVLKPNEADLSGEQFNTINDMATPSDTQDVLLAAIDNGSLASYNIRRRRFEMSSESLGYSARTVTIVKNNRKVLVGTDEGVVAVFNWNEFGNLCDRFPVRPMRQPNSREVKISTSGTHSVEKIIKISEDVVAVATDDGLISAFSILPNRLLGIIGSHINLSDCFDSGADCLTLSANPVDDQIASACPSSSSVRFWSTNRFIEQAKDEKEDLCLPKKQRRLETTIQKRAKLRQSLLSDTGDCIEHLSGLSNDKQIFG